MKKTLLYIVLILFVNITLQAQQRNRDKIKLLKTSYITDALDLTQKEAEKFWPIYNTYNDKIMKSKFSLESNVHRQVKAAGGIDNVTDKQAEEFVQNSIAMEKEVSKNKIALIEELSKVISAKKIIKLQRAERDFNKQILQEYGKRRRLQGQ